MSGQNLDSLEALEPCPFCGGKVELERTADTYSAMYGKREWWGVTCRNTENLGGTCSVQIRPSASPEAAIERWNRRAAPVSAPIAGDAVHLPEDITSDEEMWRAGCVAFRAAINEMTGRDGYVVKKTYEALRKYMLAKAATALANQPAPTAAPEQVAQAWAYCPECGSEEIHHEEGAHKQCADCHQEWWTDIDYSDVVQKHLGQWKKMSQPSEATPLASRELEYKRKTKGCPHCFGSGGKRKDPCGVCRGTGRVPK